MLMGLVQGYGLTESGGPAAATHGPEETLVHGSVGRLGSSLEARIVDPVTGESLPPGQRGELWLRGPTIMKGSTRGLQSVGVMLDSARVIHHSIRITASIGCARTFQIILI